MLSPADAALAARDPAISGLQLLLDPAAFAAALRAARPDAAIAVAEATYVRYKPATSCLAAYRLIGPYGPLKLYAVAYAAPLRGKLSRARRLTEEPGAIGVGGLTLDEHDIAVFSWPYDHELRALRQLPSRRRRARLLEELCPGRPDLVDATLSDLRYRPERRYVGRLAAPEGDALLKLYDEGDYARARAAAAAFAPAGPLRLAPPLGWSDAHRAILFPWQPGALLTATLWAGDEGQEATFLAGSALAMLHGQPAPGLPRNHAARSDGALAAACGAIGSIAPELGSLARRLAAQVSEELRGDAPAPRPLHGDFYADQVLVEAGRATLIDLDNGGWGDPAADLGNFIAHLRRGVAEGAGPAARAAQLAAALYAGYGERAAPPEPRRVALHAAAGLLRLAPEPFRYRAPGWPGRVAALMAAAEQALSAHQEIAPYGTAPA